MRLTVARRSLRPREESESVCDSALTEGLGPPSCLFGQAPDRDTSPSRDDLTLVHVVGIPRGADPTLLGADRARRPRRLACDSGAHRYGA